MKVLIDSNVILEVILRREEYEVANCLLETLHKDKHEMFMTVGSFYGMVYTVENYLRKVMELKKPERIEALRSIMLQVLKHYHVAGHDRESLLRAIGDNKFTDLEDSCQHQAAAKADCDYLISFNLKDYAEGASMKAMTPQDFLNSYLKQ